MGLFKKIKSKAKTVAAVNNKICTKLQPMLVKAAPVVTAVYPPAGAAVAGAAAAMKAEMMAYDALNGTVKVLHDSVKSVNFKGKIDNSPVQNTSPQTKEKESGGGLFDLLFGWL